MAERKGQADFLFVMILGGMMLLAGLVMVELLLVWLCKSSLFVCG